VLAWTEAELAQKEDFVGRSLAGPSTSGAGAGVELPSHEPSRCPRGTAG
jgi:hypothetical protein